MGEAEFSTLEFCGKIHDFSRHLMMFPSDWKPKYISFPLYRNQIGQEMTEFNTSRQKDASLRKVVAEARRPTPINTALCKHRSSVQF